MGKRYDPYDGEEYHVDGPMPSDPLVQERLVSHPSMNPKVFRLLLKEWSTQIPKLLKAYAEELSVEDAKRPQSQLVERLAPCFLSL